MIASKKYVDETLRNNNLVANKALGQNFLVEETIANEIIEKANITKETCVIEIGPGLGALTELIVNKAGLLKCFEIDKNMVNILTKTFEGYNNFTLTNIDFLKVDIEELIKDITKLGYKDIKIVSNLPYYITSKLLNKILVNNYPIKSVITMMQKEVANKIVRPDKKDYNTLSVILDYQYEVSIIKHVSKNFYLPRPDIDSIVLKFERVSPRFDVEFNKLYQVAESLFSQRRKTVLNNLKELTNNPNEVLEKANIDSQNHIEQLSINDIVNITKNI